MNARTRRLHVRGECVTALACAAALAGCTTGTAPTSSGKDAAPSGASTDRCVFDLPAVSPPPVAPADFCPPPTVPDPSFHRGSVTTAEGLRIGVEVADSEDERMRGLMFRPELPSGQGMLFVWPDESRRQFWMRNTCVPLDMVFIARDGTVVGVVEQATPMTDAPRFVPCPSMYVLEVNGGWARGHGLVPGRRLEINPTG